MFDKIEKKVEEIRQKPEHIRMRYVWFWVIFFMLFVIFIWVLSIQITLFNLSNDSKTSENEDSMSTIKEDINNLIPEESTSIDDLLEQDISTTESEL